ncbi:hypothetical protein Tco_1299810 [Tanacetum coccineum]
MDRVPACMLQDPSCISLRTLLAWSGPTHRSYGPRKEFFVEDPIDYDKPPRLASYYPCSFHICWQCFLREETNIREKDKNKAKNDKTEHENVKSVKSQNQKVKVKVNQKSTQSKSKSKRAENEEILNGPTRTHLMGRVSPLKYYVKTITK